MKLLMCLALAVAVNARAEQQAPPAAGAAPKTGNNVTIFDDRVFNLESNGNPDTRTSVGGATRYLDNTKEFNYNSETRRKAMQGCESLREGNYSAYSECVNGRLSKDPDSSGSRGLDSLSRKKKPMIDELRPDPATGEDLGIGED